MMGAGIAPAEKWRAARHLLGIVEQRTTNPAALAVLMEQARRDGEAEAMRLFSMFAHNPDAAGIEAAVIGRTTQFLTRSLAALTLAGHAENEVTGYRLAFAFAASDTLARLDLASRSAPLPAAAG